MVSSARPGYRERLGSAAATARDVLAASGARRWEFFTKASATREVEIVPEHEPREIEIDEVGVAVRTLRGRNAGFAAASGLEADAARRAIDGAVANETPLPFDPLPPERLQGTAEIEPAPAAPVRGWAAHATEQLVQGVAEATGGALRLRRSVFHEGTFSWLLATSEGFLASHDGTATSALVEVQATDRRRGVWREWFHLPDPAAFDASATARRIADRALLTQGPLTDGSGLSRVILAPEVAAQVLAGLVPLLIVCRHDPDPLPALLDRNGCLGSPALTLVDDRLDPTAPIVGPCDGEGLPARRIPLVEAGVPRHRLASYRDSVAFGESPRGGAVRISYRDYPASGVANLKLDTAHGRPPSELLDDDGRMLYLARPLTPIVIDAHRDVYRLVATGVWLDRRRVEGRQPVVELRGSLAMLLRRIEAVGTDLTWFQTDAGFVGAPSLLIHHQPVIG
jgi:PmbA protein